MNKETKIKSLPYKQHKQYRLPGYDYSAMGDYFITICTKNRAHHFGKITKGKNNPFIELSAIGLFVNDCIQSIPATYVGVTLGETVVMPNHIHLIITLPLKEIKVPVQQSAMQQLISPKRGLVPLTAGSVSSIINHLKGKVKKWCKANEYDEFEWQSRFHDHIIRNNNAYNRIANYIHNNVHNWKEDENNDGGYRFRKDIRIT